MFLSLYVYLNSKHNVAVSDILFRRKTKSPGRERVTQIVFISNSFVFPRVIYSKDIFSEVDVRSSKNKILNSPLLFYYRKHFFFK